MAKSKKWIPIKLTKPSKPTGTGTPAKPAKDCKGAICTKDMCPDGKNRRPFGDSCCSCDPQRNGKPPKKLQPGKKPIGRKPTKPKKKTKPFKFPKGMKKLHDKREKLRKQMNRVMVKNLRYKMKKESVERILKHIENIKRWKSPKAKAALRKNRRTLKRV